MSDTQSQPAPPLGVVAIGRNEGERLRRCLTAVPAAVPRVYVDSGSTDDSVALAQSLGASVIQLDLSEPFTAARARNAGFAKLLADHPGLPLVQFVDGDCEMVAGWLDAAQGSLQQHPEVAVVCGRRRERFPQASIYNALCDAEWNTPVGETEACGGDALFRVRAFEQVGRYNPALIAGEEPELCVRLRQAGWKILRLDQEMTWHDAAMTRWSQWWKRARRAGHAYAQGAALHGRSPQRHNVRPVLSILLWAWLIPLAAVVFAAFTQGWGALLLLVYPAQVWRIARRQRREGMSVAMAWVFAFFIVLGKFAQLIGMMEFVGNALRGKRSQIIEYKSAAPAAPGSVSGDAGEPKAGPVT
jgi:GT2 family glycosyltransferase